MQIEILVLRILHIASGAFWVGTVLFMVLFLRPRLNSLGPEFGRKLTSSVERAVSMSTGIAGLITVAAGIALVFRLRGSRLDTFFNTGWGYAILIGFIAAIGAFVAGGMAGSVSARAASISEEMESASSSGDQSALVQELGARMIRLERLHALFVLIAVGSMASARFV